MIACMIDKGGFLPEKAHNTDAGFDLRSPIAITIPARGSAVIDTGVHVAIPRKPLSVGLLLSKSGLNVKYGITTEGVIDCGYTGSIVVKLYNHSNADYTVGVGDKITQLVIFPICPHAHMKPVDTFEKTERGNGGFGSSGR